MIAVHPVPHAAGPYSESVFLRTPGEEYGAVLARRRGRGDIEGYSLVTFPSYVMLVEGCDWEAFSQQVMAEASSKYAPQFYPELGYDWPEADEVAAWMGQSGLQQEAPADPRRVATLSGECAFAW